MEVLYIVSLIQGVLLSEVPLYSDHSLIHGHKYNSLGDQYRHKTVGQEKTMYVVVCAEI